MKVSINIVTWNSLKFLPQCLESIFKQTFTDWQIVIIDNNSFDDSLNYIRQEYIENKSEDNRLKIKTLHNVRNLGFAKAHNQGIKMLDSEYVLVMNPDVILAPDFLEKLITIANQHPQAGSFAGKLLRLINPAVGDIIDSSGLQVKRNGQVVDRGSGEHDKGQFNKQEDIFGCTGALALYRRTALEDIRINGEYFDNNFFAYKEDVDLAYRLRWRGWTALYAPTALASHVRRISSPNYKATRAVIKNYRQRSKLIRYYSYRNHLLALLKNEPSANWQRDWRQIIGHELKKFFYYLFINPSNLRALIDFCKLIPTMKQKRRWIMAHRKIEVGEMRKWLVNL